ncbi:MAG: hypothetical protein QNJ98_10685 [Planctomycetota bacterium]|nr:hypothetical protein [Planctomycetota bacterium]
MHAAASARTTRLPVRLLVLAVLACASCAVPLGERVDLRTDAPAAIQPPRDVVILGRSQGRMNQVRRLLGGLENVRLLSTFNEAEALRTIDTAENLAVVLLGGATSGATRRRIRAHLAAHHPGVMTSEPGRQYRYSDANILNDVRTKIERRAR